MSFWSAAILRLWRLSNHLWSKLKPDDFRFDGGVKHFLQLGTVMAKEAFRHQGYIRAIMKQIDAKLLILTNVKIFQFPHGTCRIIGQHAPCGKKKLIVSEYRRRDHHDN